MIMNKMNVNKMMVVVSLILVAVIALVSNSKKHTETRVAPAITSEQIAKNKMDTDKSLSGKAEGLNYLMTHDKVKFKKVGLDSKEMVQMLSENEILNIKKRNEKPSYSMFEFKKEGAQDVYRYSFLWNQPAHSCVLRSQVVYAGALDTTLIKDMHPLTLNESICKKYYK
jgi:hypothetical protein